MKEKVKFFANKFWAIWIFNKFLALLFQKICRRELFRVGNKYLFWQQGMNYLRLIPWFQNYRLHILCVEKIIYQTFKFYKSKILIGSS